MFPRFERVLAEFEERAAGRQTLMQDRGRSAGDQHLAAVAEREKARGAIDRRAEVVRVALVGCARVDRHAHVQSTHFGKVRPAQRALRRERGRCSALRPRKGDAKCVAYRLEDRTAVDRDRLAQQAVMKAYGALHRRAVPVPARGASFDVGEQKRHRA